MLSCVVCGRKDKPLYRINPKGEVGKWACEEHLLNAPDPETKRLVDTISRGENAHER